LRSDTPVRFDDIQRLEAQVPGTYRITPDSRLIRQAALGEHFANGIAHAECMLAELEACPETSVN